MQSPKETARQQLYSPCLSRQIFAGAVWQALHSPGLRPYRRGEGGGRSKGPPYLGRTSKVKLTHLVAGNFVLSLPPPGDYPQQPPHEIYKEGEPPGGKGEADKDFFHSH